tara:strand:+ start:2403 stop:2564 length:162 start_codon:yes stop_codon:yes gene_type:complete
MSNQIKFQVIYQRQKKKGTSTQKATFFDERDAILWEHMLRKQGIQSETIMLMS